MLVNYNIVNILNQFDAMSKKHLYIYQNCIYNCTIFFTVPGVLSVLLTGGLLMYFPIIYPSSGEFWLNSNDLSGFSRVSKLRTSLPPGLQFQITSNAADEVADILNLTRPLHLSAPHQNFKRKTLSCIVQARTCPFPPDSFVHLTRRGYDIYMA